MVVKKRLSKLNIMVLLCVMLAGYTNSAIGFGVAGLPDNAILLITPAVITPDTINIKPDQGSFFSMEVNPGTLTYLAISGFNHLQLGVTQAASVDSPEIDEPWLFFGNLGVHQSTSPVTVLTDDGAGNVTLDFSGWGVSWNAIPEIPLGTGLDNGIATLTCEEVCAFGEKYSLIYHANVPDGDVSGKGNVKYVVELSGRVNEEKVAFDVSDIVVSEGTVTSTLVFTPGSTADAAGNITGTNLSASEIGKGDLLLDNIDGKQCIGGCIDFVVSGLTTNYIDVVFKLSEPIPAGATFRKLSNETWRPFSVENGNQLSSANVGLNGNCQGHLGDYTEGLREGALCVHLRILDGGENDSDGVKDGTIIDPAGVLLVDSLSSSSGGGCSVSSAPVALRDRMDVLLLSLFLVLLGIRKYRS